MTLLWLLLILSLCLTPSISSSSFNTLLAEDDVLTNDDVDTTGLPYEQRVTPLTVNGTVFTQDGVKMIWREGKTVYVNFTLDICRFSEHISFNHRCYNGKFLGPTITVRQGDRLVMTIVNKLGPETGEYFFNEVHWPNHTSMHFHGLHASPDEDNVFDAVQPGETKTVILNIEENHYPGTHWYHAHHHGNSAYQIFSGLHGAFIVEPADDDFYPQFFKEMRQIVVCISSLKIYAYDNGGWHGFVEYHDEVGDEIDLELDMDYDLYNNTFVINGKYQPTIEISTNEWNWMRIINTGPSAIIPLKFNSSGSCEHYAIAIDGVFLEEPLEQHAYYIFPGSRIDVAVKCTEIGAYTVEFWKDADNIWIYAGVDSADDQVLWTIGATSVSEKDPLPISDYRVPPRPNYLESLMDYTEDEIEAVYTIKSTFFDYNDFFGFNDRQWLGSGNTTLFVLELGKVYELRFITDLSVHPIHIHVNHMQVMRDDEVAWSVFDTHAMHQPGSWRDTIYSTFERNVTVRVRPDKFTGYALVHCHYVIHADRGMMAEIELRAPPTEGVDGDQDIGGSYGEVSKATIEV